MALKKFFLSGAVAATLGFGGLVVSATEASAYVACNPDGDCWHTDRREHVPGVTFTYHPDDWYFHQHWDADHHWREHHDGRGYWRNGLWVTL